MSAVRQSTWIPRRSEVANPHAVALRIGDSATSRRMTAAWLSSCARSRGLIGGSLRGVLFAAALAACTASPVQGPLSTDSRNAAARDYLALAKAWLDAGDFGVAERHLEHARSLGADSAESHHISALLAAASAEPERAENHYRRALALAPGGSAIRNNYGVLLFSQGRAGEAAGQFRAAAADPAYVGRAWALENLGRSRLLLGDWQGAREAFDAALEAHGELPVAALELALLHRRSGDLAAARRLFADYLAMMENQGLEPGPKALFAGAEFALQAGNCDQVEEFGSILGTLYPETAEYRAYRNLIDGD